MGFQRKQNEKKKKSKQNGRPVVIRTDWKNERQDMRRQLKDAA